MAIEIFVDESWTHTSEIRRYWCFYGGLFGESSDVDRLDSALRAVKTKHGEGKEVAWGNLNALNVRAYEEYLDTTLDSIANGGVKFRQIFCDRSIVRVGQFDEEDRKSLDIQYLLCYQFLKHAFGLRHVNTGSEVLVRLDTHSSQKHRDQLESFGAEIPRILHRSDVQMKLSYHSSARVPRIQAVDLMIGAAGFHGNKCELRREPGQKRISKKNALRKAFAKRVYDGLRSISNDERGKQAFNWFETTGKCGIADHRMTKKVHIWKFLPRRYQVDKGWHNDHLVRGEYQGPDIQPGVHSTDDYYGMSAGV